MEKVAISIEGPTLQDSLDPRFGRAAGFLIVDVDTLETNYVDNGSAQSMAQGAGIQATENIVNAGAKVLLTGVVGPKAFQALSAAGVQVCQNLSGLTGAEALVRYKSGQAPVASGPNK